MLKVEEARKIVLDNTAILQSEPIDITNSLNRVLAGEIYSEENIPPFDNSAMDGYALISAITEQAEESRPATLQVIGHIAAGSICGEEVQNGTAVKIMTGAPLPAGADAVIPVEFTRIEGPLVKIFREAQKWENIRFAGEDVKRGQLVIPEGKVIRPAEIGMLAAMNIRKVNVVKTPVVAFLATGNELLELGEALLPGKIRDINSYSLYAQILKYGAVPVNLGKALDTKESIRDKLEKGIDSDILIISGGVSVGDFDYVKNVLADMGMKEKFWKVAMKPGKPVLFGLIGNTPVFGLPGNPVSSMVAFEQFVLPAIYKMQGKKRKPWKEVNATLEEGIKKKPGLTHFVRGRTSIKNSRIYVKPIGLQSSGAFSSLVLADCLIVLPEDATDPKCGQEVLVQFTDEIGG